MKTCIYSKLCDTLGALGRVLGVGWCCGCPSRCRGCSGCSWCFGGLISLLRLPEASMISFNMALGSLKGLALVGAVSWLFTEEAGDSRMAMASCR
jgi:hypothetical protein